MPPLVLMKSRAKLSRSFFIDFETAVFIMAIN
jgi:hypothetical protein